MSNTIWAVDGSFFAQRLSGIQRYSIELLAALDRIVPPGFVEIVTWTMCIRIKIKHSRCMYAVQRRPIRELRWN